MTAVIQSGIQHFNETTILVHCGMNVDKVFAKLQRMNFQSR